MTLLAEKSVGIPRSLYENGGSPVAVPRRAGGSVVRPVLRLVAVLALGFVAQLAAVGEVTHARDQTIAYASLREQLANATAPVGPVPPGRPVALLEIPAAGVREVVFEGTTSGVLASGPGHRRDTPLPGQPGTSVVLGRRAAYGGPFAQLAALQPGDAVTVTTGQGRHSYRVPGVRRAGDPVPPAPRTGRLTLVTASGPAYLPGGVLRVDADLVTAARPGSRPAAIAAAERPLAGDPAAWIAVVLWGEALLLALFGLVWLRARWGRWHAWVPGVPLLLLLGGTLADQAARLLPNLI